MLATWTSEAKPMYKAFSAWFWLFSKILWHNNSRSLLVLVNLIEIRDHLPRYTVKGHNKQQTGDLDLRDIRNKYGCVSATITIRGPKSDYSFFELKSKVRRAISFSFVHKYNLIKYYSVSFSIWNFTSFLSPLNFFIINISQFKKPCFSLCCCNSWHSASLERQHVYVFVFTLSLQPALICCWGR